MLSRAVVRALRTALTVGRSTFQVTPHTARPGSGLRVTAHVEPRWGRRVTVRAVLTCTLFDHRPRALYRHSVDLAPIENSPFDHAAFVRIPAIALRTGVVGDTLSNLFSEDAHRLLVSWSLDIEVRDADQLDRVLLLEAVPIEVPEGRPLQPDATYMDALIVEACAATHSDLLLNAMVRLAASDGVIDPRERTMLHDLLRSSEGLTDPAAADARIAVELRRNVEVDASLLRKHIPARQLASAYRLLYAMAWRDGQLDGREHAFLLDVLSRFGLDRSTVSEIERDILAHYGAHLRG